jgi:hypothetical protein
MKKNKLFVSLIFLWLFLSLFFCGGDKRIFAIDNKYSNQLLKVDVEKAYDDDNAVTLTLYSSKPYKIKVTPIKKSDNEYVIFLPETYHSITSRPDISSSDGKVKDLDVKLVPYVGDTSNNGYTKITVKTHGEDLKLNVNNEVIKQSANLTDDLTAFTKSKSHPKTVKTKAVPLPEKQKQASNPYNFNSIFNKPSNENINKPIKNTKSYSAKSNTNYVKPKSSAGRLLYYPSEQSPQESHAVENIEQNTTQKIPTVGAKHASKIVYQNEETEQGFFEGLYAKIQYQFEHNKFFTEKFLPLLLMVFWTLVIVLAMKMSHKRKTSVLQDVLDNKQELYEEKQNFKKDKGFLNRINQQRPISVRQTLSTGAGYGSNIRAKNTQDSVIFTDNYTEVPLDTISAEELYVKEPPVKAERHNSYFQNKPRQLSTKRYTIVKDIKKELEKEKVQRHEPEIIEGYDISDGRGFYLIKIENTKTLIGIMNAEVFVIKNFERMRYSKFIVKKTQGIDRHKDIFFVQVDNWRGLVSSTPKRMKLELVL